MKRITSPLLAIILATLACTIQPLWRNMEGTPAPIPSLQTSPYGLGRTLYGFFPSPPKATTQSVIETYQAIGQHGDVVLLQQNIPWDAFSNKIDSESQAIIDIHNQYILAHQNGVEVLFVVDPFNGLNRREFQGLPSGWEANFANPKVRSSFSNYTLRIVQEFHPKYLGLASEINTYNDTHPEDFPNYLTLYNEVYARVKAVAPDTIIFVTFQWEELNNLIPSVAQGEPYVLNWSQVEQFEPNLDLWAISSYPFVIFPSGAAIPVDYYTPLLTRTSKPLAVAEGGFPSEPMGPFPGDPQSQVDYLKAIHTQIGGSRLAFWIYLLINDFSLESYAPLMKQNGQGKDIDTLSIFASAGLTKSDRTPKPALAVWDSYRNNP
jgi:hypothetical protein